MSILDDDFITKELNSKEFLEEIAQLHLQLSKEIQAKQYNLDPSPKARAERRRRVLKDGDFLFFAYTYFPHHIWGEKSKFQNDFCHKYPKVLRTKSGVRIWWVAPRGETKSTLNTKIGPVWIAVQAMLEDPKVRAEIDWQGETPPFNDYVLFLGAETKMPTKLMEVVKTELLVNGMLALDFPEACGKSDKWKVGEFVSQTGVKYEPFGAEQAVRGTFHFASRPKVLIPDDIITDKEAKSPTERDNRWNWLENSIDYLGPPDGSVKCIGVGTILNKDDPISRSKHTIGYTVYHFKAIEQMPTHMDLWEQCEAIMRNDDKSAEESMQQKGAQVETEDLPSYKFYLTNKKKMDAGAITSWPAVRSLYWLMRQRAKNKKAFETEMQGNARSDQDRIFTHWNFWVQRLQHWIMLASCDPSMGKGLSSHPSAILVGGYDTRINKLNVIEAKMKRRVPSKLESDIINTQREYQCTAWAFENNNAYEHMRLAIIQAALKQGVSLPLIGVTATVPPEVRIDSLETFICDALDPRILFHSSQTQLISQLEDWPEKQSAHHYDGLVALHLLWMLAVSRAGGIPSIGTAGSVSRSQRTDFNGYDG